MATCNLQVAFKDHLLDNGEHVIFLWPFLSS
jgi:hypothetical protein